jgi:hypothetical protein
VTKSKRIQGTGHVTLVAEKRRAYGIFLTKPRGNREIIRPVHRLKGNKIISEKQDGDADWVCRSDAWDQWWVLSAIH